VFVCVCVCELAHTDRPSAIGPMYCPTRHQIGARWRTFSFFFSPLPLWKSESVWVTGFHPCIKG